MLDKYKIIDDVPLYEENRKLKGYNINVVDDWGQKIKKRFVTEKELQLYLSEFGKKIVSDSEFYAWYSQIKKTSSSS